MDYEYDDEPLDGRILWGRIAVYGAAFVLVFILGSCFGGRGGVSEDEVTELNDRIRDLASENEVLSEQLEAVSARQTAPATPSPDPTPTASEGEGDGDTSGEGDSGGERTYTVVSGDTLYGIAEEHYGDGSKWRIIADANGLDADNRVTVGQELKIPPLD